MSYINNMENILPVATLTLLALAIGVVICYGMPMVLGSLAPIVAFFSIMTFIGYGIVHA